MKTPAYKGQYVLTKIGPFVNKNEKRINNFLPKYKSEILSKMNDVKIGANPLLQKIIEVRMIVELSDSPCIN